MRAVIQRVSHARVLIRGEVVGQIGRGLLALVSFGHDDTDEDLQFMVNKIAGLRMFEDEQGRMNLSVEDIGGGILVVPNFTIHGDCRKGRRPSFTAAAPPEQAEELFDQFVRMMADRGLTTASGKFGAHMHVELVNDGPVTLLLDSKKLF